MTIVCRPINASSGSPSYTASNERQSMAALVQNGSTRPFGTNSGKSPGTGLAVSRSGNTLSASSGSMIIDPAFSAPQGAYLVAYDNTASPWSQVLTIEDSVSTRIDSVSVQVSDTDVDGSGGRSAAFVYTTGTPGSGTPPATPARSLRLCTISVPNSAGGGRGSATVTQDSTFAVAAGGILPVANSSAYPATPYVGMVIFDMSAAQILAWAGAWYAVSVGVPSAYTPTWTNLATGNGTVTTEVSLDGKYLNLRIAVLFGSTTAISGNVSVSLPAGFVTPNDTAQDILCKVGTAGGGQFVGFADIAANGTTLAPYILRSSTAQCERLGSFALTLAAGSTLSIQGRVRVS